MSFDFSFPTALLTAGVTLLISSGVFLFITDKLALRMAKEYVAKG